MSTCAGLPDSLFAVAAFVAALLRALSKRGGSESGEEGISTGTLLESIEVAALDRGVE